MSASGGIEGNRDGIDQPLQLREDIAPVDQVGLAVGIDPDPYALRFQPGGDLLHQVEAQQRFAIAAEDDFIPSLRIAYRGNDFRRSRLPLQLQVVPLDGEILEFGAEGCRRWCSGW